MFVNNIEICAVVLDEPLASDNGWLPLAGFS